MRLENKLAIEKLFNSKVIAVVRNCEFNDLVPLASVLLEGGIDAIEITMEQPNAVEKIVELNKFFGKELKIGAGTVINREIAISAIKSGAKYIVSPTLNADIIKVCKDANTLVIPGAFTPTEILQANDLGADAVKIFPASVLGPKYIKQIKGPLPHIPIIATGGIDEDNVESYLSVGVNAVGIGGNLVKLEQEDKFNRILEVADRIMTKCKKY